MSFKRNIESIVIVTIFHIVNYLGLSFEVEKFDGCIDIDLWRDEVNDNQSSLHKNFKVWAILAPEKKIAGEAGFGKLLQNQQMEMLILSPAVGLFSP